jgi:hypothetical protein
MPMKQFLESVARKQWNISAQNNHIGMPLSKDWGCLLHRVTGAELLILHNTRSCRHSLGYKCGDCFALMANDNNDGIRCELS